MLVRRHVLPGPISISKRALRFDQSLVGRLPQQRYRAILIRFASLPLSQHDSQIVLREPVTEVGRPLVPDQRLSKIKRNALAGAIQHAKLKLR